MKKSNLWNPLKCQTDVKAPGLRGLYFHQCTRNIWKDGFCKIHHPESVRERQAKSEARRKKQSPYEALKRAYEKVNDLAEKNKSLWSYLDRNFPRVAKACREAPAVKK